MTRAAALAVALLLPLVARAQSNPDAGAPSPEAPPSGDPRRRPMQAPAAMRPPPGKTSAGTTSAAADGGAAPRFEPPRLLSDRIVPAPANAPAITGKVVVTVKLLVDVAGAVQKVEVKTPPQPPFDDAVIAAAKAFKFQPGRYAGAPVPVAITFTNTFLPPPPPPVPESAIKDEGPARTSVLRGRLIELGTRAPIAGATVTAVVGDRHYSVEADLRGKFRLALPPGNAKVSVYAPSHNPFVQDETLAPKQELAVKYLVERDRYDPYEFTAVAERKRRDEVSRITLRGAEIKQIPGTFGDPFRVVQTLPGVASVVSLLPYPVVRGASPSSTGFLLDGTRVPLLYHLLLGTSVVHPEFIDEIQFYPGGAPAPYGGYTGGIIDGRTARARPDEHLLDFDANFLQAGGFVREPIKPIGATFTAAARYGYPGLLLSLATDRLTLAYWDYQLRLDGGTPRNAWTVFFFGANDELDTVAATADPNAPNPPLTPTLILGFHRGDFRYRHADGAFEENLRLVAGYDHTFSAGTDFHVWSAEPTATMRWTPTPKLTFDLGVQAFFHKVDQGAGAVAGQNAFTMLTAQLDKFYGVSPYRRGAVASDAADPDPSRRPRRHDIRRHHHEVRRRSAADRALQAGRSQPARRAVRQRRQRDLAQGQRRHLSPAAALRAAAARPGHDAAQVRPLALVPDQPGDRDPARAALSIQRRGVLQLHGPDDLRPADQQCDGHHRAQQWPSAEHDRQSAEQRAEGHRSADPGRRPGAPTAARS